MDTFDLQLICGVDFWIKLEDLLKNAKNRVFIFSAFVKESIYKKYMNMIPKNVYTIFMCREKENKYNFVPEDAIVLSKDDFHGKVYLIDDTIIIGSQNLYEPKKLKEGEFSILMTSESSYISLFLYEVLQVLIKGHDISIQPISDSFFDLYSVQCPFCGQTPTDSNVRQCRQYGFNYVSDDDCDSYDGDGGCKYCNRDEEDLIEAIFCDDSGCGFGISMEDKDFIMHAINPPSQNEVKAAENYIRLFHFLEDEDIDAVEAFEKLGINGDVYNASLKKTQTFVPIDSYDSLLRQCKYWEEEAKGKKKST